MDIEARPRIPWRLLAAGCGVALVMVLGGIWYHHNEVGRLRQQEYAKLASIGALKAGWIAEWRSSIRADASRSGRDPFLVEHIAELVSGAETPGLREQLRSRLALDQEEGTYLDILLLGPDDRVLLSTTEPPGALTSASTAVAAEARSARSVVLSDLTLDAAGRVVLAGVAPILDPQGAVQGTVVMHQDADQKLYPALLSWPVPSASAETLLVRRDGDEVHFLSELRYQQGASLSQHLPLSMDDLPAARAIQGDRGVFEGPDYRDRAVLSDLRPVEGSPWFLVTKVDDDEAFAVVRSSSKIIIGLVVLLVLVVATMTAYLYRQRQAHLLEILVDAERQRRLAQQNLRTTLYCIGDGVIATDATGRVQVVNRAAEELTGWREPEARGRPLHEVYRILNEESRSPVPNPVERVLREGDAVGLADHTLLVARDGTERPIAGSGAPVRDEQGAFQGAVLVFRDQTVERRTAGELQRLTSVLAAVRDIDKLVVRERDVARLIEQACATMIQTSGFSQAWFFLTDEGGRVTGAASAGFGPGRRDPVQLFEQRRTPGCLAAMDHPGALDGEALHRACAPCPKAGTHGGGTRLVIRLTHNDRCRGVLGVARLGSHPIAEEERSLLTDLAGDLGFALGNIEEEAERRRAEESLRHAAVEYRSLADNMPALIVRIDPELRYVYLNPLAAATFGVTPEAYLGKVLAETAIPGVPRGFWEPSIRAAFEADQPLEVEGEVNTPGGRRHLRAILVPERAQDGSVHSVLCLAQDTTKEKRADELLRARMRLLEFAATHSLPELLRQTVDEAEALSGSLIGFYHFVDADEQAISLQAWSTRTARDFCRAEEHGEHYAIARAGVWADCVRTRAPVVHNDYAALPDKRGQPEGHALVIRELVVPVFRGGRIVAILGVGNKTRDYTDEDVIATTYLADVAWEIAERVRADVAREIVEDQLRGSQKLEAIGGLAGGVAHDFNNLLSVILSYTEFAMEALPEGDPIREDLLEVRGAGERAAALTRQLLAFSRRQVMQPVALDMNQVAAGIEKMLRRILGEDIDFIQRLAPGLGLVQADAGQIEQVLMNLVVNARDAMPRGGKLTIETANVELDAQYASHHVAVAPGSYVLLVVTDTGCGMDEQTRARIFEPFFTTKVKGKGTGLGLSTVYGIIKQSSGNIWVYSEPDLGTTFKVYLPRDLSATVAEPEPAAVPLRCTGTETILLVEDEDALKNVALRTLTEAGYTVLAATDGEEALAISAQHGGDIQLLLTDVVMPNMGGRVLAERLALTRPQTAVLYMSGYTDSAIGHHGALDVGTHFLAKPFTAAELARKVREALDAGSADSCGEAVPPEEADAQGPPLEPEALAALPAAILRALHRAATTARYGEIIEIAETIRGTAPDVAKGLCCLAERFDYAGIRSLLEK